MEIIYYLIYLVNVAAWLLPPFRQWRTRFFTFFLLLGITDPLTILSIEILHIPHVPIYVMSSYLILLSLYDFKLLKKFLPVIILGLAALIVLVLALPSLELQFTIPVLHMLILFTILKIFLDAFNHSKKLNLFYFVLVLYEVSIVTKFIVNLTDYKTGTTDFVISTLFGVLIAIFFTIYREDSAPTFSLKRFVDVDN